MAFVLPNKDVLRRLAADIGMDVDDVQAAEMLEVMQPMVAGFRLIERLPDEPLATCYPRTPGRRPDPNENPYGAWAVMTDIHGAAEGALAGRRVAIKDNVAIAGVPLMNGASVLEGFVPDGDAAVVTRILDAGGHIVGKSVCEYFCFAGGSATSASGPVISPRNPGHSAGGSSSGSAALLAAGEVDFAIGADQGGSIRIPASFSGIVGHKPTYGLVPYTGVMGLDYTIDHVGPMARTVADCALLLEVIAGEDGIDGRQRNVRVGRYSEDIKQGLKGLRIGVVTEGFKRPESDPATDEAVRAAAADMARAGAVLEEVSIPWHNNGLALWAAVAIEGTFHTLIRGHGNGYLTNGAYSMAFATALGSLMARANELPATLKLSMLLGYHADHQYQGRFYAKAQNLRWRLRREYDAALQRFDLLLMPTLPFPTLPIPPDDASVAEMFNHNTSMVSNTCPFDLTGHPAISVPCGVSGDKPVGLMLIGRHFEDGTVLRGAAGWEGL